MKRSTIAGATACALYLLLTATWWWLIWHAPPQVVPNGDGGNVASIAAGWLDRARFAEDPVLVDSRASRFYMALTVPITMLLGSAIGDLGSGYLIQIVPLLFLQLAGFHLLGTRLFGHHGFAMALALLSIPPVYMIGGGELWGMYDVPLTRTFATAALPWLLLLLVGTRGSRHRTLLSMLACGLSIYLHPVSAPALAAGCWLALAIDRAPTTSWPRHLVELTAGAFVFMLAALPFALVFFQGFPGGSSSAAGDTLRKVAGPYYFDVRLVVENLTALSGMVGSFERRAIVWGGGLLAIGLLPVLDTRVRVAVKLLVAFLVGIVASSIGVSALDQWTAMQRNSTPLQIDLIRNVRFVAPLLMISFVWLLAVIAGKFRHTSAASIVAAFTITALWWHDHPTPIYKAIREPARFAAAPDPTSVAASHLLTRIRALPPHTRILPLAPSAEGANGPIELLGLAVRYAAFQSVVFLEKDGNLLSYSSSTASEQWMETTKQVVRLRNSSGGEAADIVRHLARHLGADYLIVHAGITGPLLLDELRLIGPIVAQEGPWHLIGLRPASAARR